MEIDANSQRRARDRHQSVRLISRVKRDSSDALMHRVQQERAHTFKQPTGEVILMVIILK